MNPAAIIPMLYPETEPDPPERIFVISWLALILTFGLTACGGGQEGGLGLSEPQAITTNYSAEVQAAVDANREAVIVGAFDAQAQAVIIGTMESVADKKNAEAVFVGAFD